MMFHGANIYLCRTDINVSEGGILGIARASLFIDRGFFFLKYRKQSNQSFLWHDIPDLYLNNK